MAKDVLITPGDALIQFSSSAGTGSGQIFADDNNDLVISNLVGDVLLGDGESDVFIGDGTNNVDIVFEQNGEIKDDGSGKNIIFGSKTTNVFVTGSNTVALQSGGGNVGIGTSAATTELQVLGDISASGTIIGNSLTLGGTAVAATATELNKMDGGTAASNITPVDADRVVYNDDGVMKQVTVTKLASYFDDEITNMPNLADIGTNLTVDGNITTTGNTTLGNATTDTHTFTGHITASGNISASGHISSSELTVVGNIHANGVIIGDDATIISNINRIELDSVRSDADQYVNIGLGTNGIEFNVNTGDSYNFNGDLFSNADLNYYDSNEDVIFNIDQSVPSVHVGVLSGVPDTTFMVNGTSKFSQDSEFLGNVSGSATSTGSFGLLQVEGANFTSASLAAGGGGGSTNAAGSDTQVQFNDGGTNFGGDSGLVFNKSSDTLTATNIGAFTLSGKLTAGSTEIEGSNFDINGGTIDGITSLTAGGDLDIGAHDFRAATLTADGLTSGRVVFAGTNGVLSDDADLTFATDTLSATKFTSTNISASGDITASGFNLVGSGTAELEVDGHITASGDISASGYVYADRVYVENKLALSHGDNAGSVRLGYTDNIPIEIGRNAGNSTSFTGHITASGDISASGTIITEKLNVNPFSPTSPDMSLGNWNIGYGTGADLTGSISSDGDGYGEIAHFGNGATLAGRVYCLKSDSTWEVAGPNGAISSSLLAVAMGTHASASGMLLRGVVKGDRHDTLTVGQKVYNEANGRVAPAAGSDSGDVVRVLGYVLNATNDIIYFNPDNTWVEHS